MDSIYEDDAFEIARRVLKSYSPDSEPPDELVNDLSGRIHRAARDIANERVEESIRHNFDVPSSPIFMRRYHG